jgi:hypothetical protein
VIHCKNHFLKLTTGSFDDFARVRLLHNLTQLIAWHRFKDLELGTQWGSGQPFVASPILETSKIVVFQMVEKRKFKNTISFQMANTVIKLISRK